MKPCNIYVLIQYIKVTTLNSNFLIVYSSENILFLYLQNILAQLIQISERLHQLMDLSSKTFQLISINIFFYFCSYQSPIANAESPHKDLNQEHSYCYFYKHQYVILSLLCLFFLPCPSIASKCLCNVQIF